jgi:hypothetical protein
MKLNIAVQVLLLASAAKASTLHSNLGLLAVGKENLVKNGSFEETVVAPNTWAHFDQTQIPGWKSLNNERVELWGAGFLGVPAPHGKNILEIDYNNAAIDFLYQVRRQQGGLFIPILTIGILHVGHSNGERAKVRSQLLHSGARSIV